MSEIQKGHYGYTKDIPLSKEHRKKIGDSKRGRKFPRLSIALRGKPSWIKGKHHTEEARRKLSKAKKGKPNPKMRGGNNPQWKGGKVERVCEVCEKKFKVKPSLVKNGGGKYCSTFCYRKTLSERFLGENNPQWKGGIKKVREKIRASLKYRQWRQNVFIRDEFTCQECGEVGGILRAHHLKPFEEIIKEVKMNLPLFGLYDGAMIYKSLWDINNGMTICHVCHTELHKGEV